MMARYDSNGCAMQPGAISKYLEGVGKAGGGKCGAYQVEKAHVVAPDGKYNHEGLPKPKEHAETPGV